MTISSSSTSFTTSFSSSFSSIDVQLIISTTSTTTTIISIPESSFCIIPEGLRGCATFYTLTYMQGGDQCDYYSIMYMTQYIIIIIIIIALVSSSSSSSSSSSLSSSSSSSHHHHHHHHHQPVSTCFVKLKALKVPPGLITFFGVSPIIHGRQQCD
jgi:hypothetical protein